MTEQDIARLWQRFAARKSPWGEAAARRQLRELGFDPFAPPPEFAAKTGAEGGAPDRALPPESGAAAGELEADPSTAPAAPPRSPSPSELGEDLAADEGGIPGRARDDENEGGDDEGGGEAEPAHPAATSHAVPTPDPSRKRKGSEASRSGVGEFPAPSREARRHRWTRARMVAFLHALAACRNVSQAARSVGMGRQSAYKLRQRKRGTPFALAWDMALEPAGRHLAREVLPCRPSPFRSQGLEIPRKQGRHRG